MTNITKKTAPNVSVGADTEQPSQKCTANIITTEDENFKSFEEIQREMIRMMDPSYLKTVSMTELYDTVYQATTPPLRYRAEINPTKSYTLSVIPKLCYGNWSEWKRNFGKSRPNHCLKR